MNSPEQEPVGWEDEKLVANIFAIERQERRKSFKELRRAIRVAEQFGDEDSTRSSFHTIFGEGDSKSYVLFRNMARKNGGFVTRVVVNSFRPSSNFGREFIAQDYTVNDRKNVIALSHDARNIPCHTTEIPNIMELRAPVLYIGSDNVSVISSPNYQPIPPDERLFSGDNFADLQKRRNVATALTILLERLDDVTHDENILVS